MISRFVKLEFTILMGGFHRENRLVKMGNNLEGNKNNVDN